MRNYNQTVDDLARATLRGEYGNGAEREQRLGRAYKDVQARVNEIIDIEACRVIDGHYGNGEERVRRLGALYPPVQARVNDLLTHRP